jgi:hypothetical protein
MKDFNITETSKNPEINFNVSEGIIEIKGRSIMEDPKTFYQPLLKALDEQISFLPDLTKVTVWLEYYNTGSSQYILTFFKKLGNISKLGKKINVNWLYEEEEMIVDGQVFQTLAKIPFKMVKIEE